MLREYQKKAIIEIEKSVSKNICLQMPTGSGKTFTFCEIAKRFFAENMKSVLIIVHRIELLEQTYKSLGERCFKIVAGVKTIPHDYDYYVAMVESVNRRLEKLPEFGLVIIDETHFANFFKLPFFESNSKLLGVTATPIATKPLSNYYNELIIPVSIEDLINVGHLVNCNCYGIASESFGKQKFKVKMGEYDEKQLEDFYSSEKMVKNVIKSYWDFSAGKKTLIFNVNLKHNDAVYSALLSEQLNVYKITGDTPAEERKLTLRKFKNENDSIICNVGVLTTGFDEPTVKTIILNRATKSLALYLQMIGRGSRPSDGKEKFTVIDLGRNVERHGFYDDFFDWQEYFKQGTKKESTGVAPVKECPECGFLQHTRKIICENCGHDFEEERLKQQKEEKEQKIILLLRNKPINIPTFELFELANDRGWKPYAVLHRVAEHFAKYENKHKIELDKKLCLESLSDWCKKYQKPYNSWHIYLINKLIDEKRRGYNTVQNSDMVQKPILPEDEQPEICNF